MDTVIVITAIIAAIVSIIEFRASMFSVKS